MRALLILVVVTGMAFWWGGKNVLLALHERDPVEITCADYLKSKPDAQWLRLTQCAADVDNMAVETENERPTKVYIPLRPIGEDAKSSAKIVLERDDSDMLAIAKDDAPTESVAKRVAAELQAPQEGLLSEPSSSDRSELAKLNLGLDYNFTIIERGNAPKLGLGLLALVGGLLGIGLLLRLFVRKKSVA